MGKNNKKLADDRPSVRVPWLKMSSPEIDKVIGILVGQLSEYKNPYGKKQRLDKKRSDKLTQDFKNAGMSRSEARKFMRDLAEMMGIENPESAVFIGPMKERFRAEQKADEENRNLHDLGRGRILVKSPEEVLKFYNMLKSMDKEGHIKGLDCKTVQILDDSITDYLKKQRSSGYCGSLNFDIRVDLGKGRFGTFEIQIMPEEYEQPYDHSHALYDMIRIIESIPGHWRSAEQTKVLNALVMANSAIFNEHAERTEFLSLRASKSYQKISVDELRETNEILDRIRTLVDKAPGRRFAWREDTLNAITYAKSSLLNIFNGDKPFDRKKTLSELSPPESDDDGLRKNLD